MFMKHKPQAQQTKYTSLEIKLKSYRQAFCHFYIVLDMETSGILCGVFLFHFHHLFDSNLKTYGFDLLQKC